MVGRFKSAGKVTPLANAVERYLEDVARMRGARTPQVYRGPLSFFTRRLKASLRREPQLADPTLERARVWLDTLLRTPRSAARQVARPGENSRVLRPADRPRSRMNGPRAAR